MKRLRRSSNLPEVAIRRAIDAHGVREYFISDLLRPITRPHDD